MKRSLAILATMALGVVRAAPAQSPATMPFAPAALQGVDVEQRLGASLPLDAAFRDDDGRAVRLGDLFHPGRPVVLTLVYFQCPMLCTVTLNQLTRGLTMLGPSAGKDFDVVAVSFDPRETPDLAAAKKRSYLRAYRRPDAANGWHFLTGDAASIDAVTRAAGFRYRWDAAQQMFVHPGLVMVATPRGRISRYFLAVDYPPTELKSALDVARQGDVGVQAESAYFYCVRYDPETGHYGLLIGRALRGLAVLSIVGLVALWATLQAITVRRTRRAAYNDAGGLA